MALPEYAIQITFVSQRACWASLFVAALLLGPFHASTSPYLTQFFRQKAALPTTSAVLAGNMPSGVFSMPSGVALDSAGNLFVVDSGNFMVRKIATDGVVSSLAGVYMGSADGTGPEASFGLAYGLATDGSGNVYVADTMNMRIRKVTPGGVVTTLAGFLPGSADGTGSSASFSYPSSVAVNGAGNVYVADSFNNMIRKITPGGVVTTLAGSTTGGATDATGSAARFNRPSGVAVDAAGNVFVADTNNHLIRKISPGGVVTTLAGAGVSGATDATGTSASFNAPNGLAVDASGNIFVADTMNHRIRKIDVAGVTSTLAGSTSGSADGTGIAAQFSQPMGVVVDGAGNVFVADKSNALIRKVTSAGVVTTLTGRLINGSVNGTGSAARFQFPASIAVATGGVIYVADSGNNLIRRISPAGAVTTYAGSGTSGSANGTGAAASFNSPNGVAVDAAGNVYVAEVLNHQIRKIAAGGVVTTLAGSTTPGSSDGTGAGASFRNPGGLDVDTAGNVHVADTSNHMIRKITPAGVVSTLAGNTTSGATNATGAAASFNSPGSLVVDGAGNVFVADTNNNMIRKITAGGVVTTVAGSTTRGWADGTGTAAAFYRPGDVGVDAAGNVYVADSWNHTIRRITPAGVVSTVIGQVGGMANTFGGPVAASVNGPRGLVVTATQLFIVGPHGVLRSAIP